jgi:hypothetical protein
MFLNRHSLLLMKVQPPTIRPLPRNVTATNHLVVGIAQVLPHCPRGWVRSSPTTMLTLILFSLLLVLTAQARYVYVPPPAPMCYGSECVKGRVSLPRNRADIRSHSYSGQKITCPASREVVIITVCSVIGQ